MQDRINVAEKPVKELIRDYFLFLDEKSKEDLILRVSMPKEYKEHIKMIKKYQKGTMDPKYLKDESLFKIPRTADKATVDQDPSEPNPKTWKFSLSVVNPAEEKTMPDIKVIDDFLKPIPKALHKMASEELLKAVGGVFSAPGMIYKVIRENNRKLLDKIGLIADSETGIIIISDSSFSPMTWGTIRDEAPRIHLVIEPYL